LDLLMDKQALSQLRSQIVEHEHERILANFVDLPGLTPVRMSSRFIRGSAPETPAG
jgi:hypothetical protein